MDAVSWIGLVLGAAGLGACVVCLLAAPRRMEHRCVALGLLSLVLSIWMYARLVSSYGRVDLSIYAALFWVAGIVGGYGLASSLLSSIATRPQRVEPLTLPAAEPRSGTAVIVVAAAEPELYDPRMTAAELDELSEESSSADSITLTPFLYAAQKARYRAAGGKSPATHELDSIITGLRLRLDVHDHPYVDLVRCASRRTLVDAVIEAVDAGFRDIVIAGLTIGESFQIDRAKCSVDALRAEQAGIRLAHTPPLWASETLAGMVARRIVAATETPSVTGVALIAHGQPPGLSRSHHAFDAQEQSFLNRVRLLLLEAGLEDHLIRLGWTHWRDPDVTETIRHLAALGAKKILVCPACDPVDTISTMLDLPLAARQARVDPPARIIQLGAWGDEPEIVDALVEAIDEMSRELRNA